MTPQKLTPDIWDATKRVYYDLKRRIRKTYRLSSTAADVLLMLDSTRTRPARLAERLGMTQPNTMRTLRNLRRHRLLALSDDPDHPGMLLASLTKRGQNAINPNL